jgi:hypothetical protein
MDLSWLCLGAVDNQARHMTKAYNAKQILQLPMDKHLPWTEAPQVKRPSRRLSSRPDSPSAL